MALPLYIAIPAWTQPYVELATRWTIPAVLASLDARSEPGPVTYLIHTDDQAAFRKALPGRDIVFLPHSVDETLRDGKWVAFKRAHREAIAACPVGAILTLLNSDIVVSRETFQFVQDTFTDDKINVIVSVGIRTLIDGNQPPIGADAETLAQWIWRHRHAITSDCIWGKGRTGHPTILFWDDGVGNVGMGGFHLTPMWVRKDRELDFLGTIDDDMLEHYTPEECHFMTAREAIFAELSPKWKTHRSNPHGLSIGSVVAFGRRHTFRPSHLRNFAQSPMTVLGSPKRHGSVDKILAGLS